MNLVKSNMLGKTLVLLIWHVTASSNQLPQHYAFNESGKPTRLA
jgi:hypothetical protein